MHDDKRSAFHHLVMIGAYLYALIPILICCVTGPLFMNLAPIFFLTGICLISGVGQQLDALHEANRRHAPPATGGKISGDSRAA